MTLRLTLLGTLRMQVDDQPPLRFPTNKARALLVYLVVENGRFHSRSSLANLLWPRASTRQGRQNLSQTLRRQRLTLAQTDPNVWAKTFQTTAQEVIAIPHNNLFCDVISFQQLLAQTATHPHEAIHRCATCLAHLEQAVALYKGSFLADFSLPDAALFDEWVAAWQSQLQHQAVAALDTLIAAAVSQGNDMALEQYARRQVAIEPWRENGWRHLLFALLRLNRHHEAVQSYHSYRQSLEHELGIQPSFTLRQLVDQIRAETLPNVPKEPQPSQSWQSLIASARQGETANVQDFAVSQAGDRLLAVDAAGIVRLWDVAAGELGPIWVGAQTAVSCVALSPNGRLAAVGTAEGQIICWQVADGTIVQEWAAHASSVRRITFLPNSHALLSVGTNGILRLWHPPF